MEYTNALFMPMELHDGSVLTEHCCGTLGRDAPAQRDIRAPLALARRG